MRAPLAASTLLAFLAAACDRAPPADTAAAGPPGVAPLAETVPVGSAGDAADDAAVWVDPARPERSVVIGTDKRRGLQVYDLEGRLLQDLPDGRMNNVDLRGGYAPGARDAALVAASNRSDGSIALYWLDTATRRLERAAAPIPTGFPEPYGLCLYRARDGATHVFVNEDDTGRFRQWRLRFDGDAIAGDLVREFHAGSQAEGCVADDGAGALYVAEEDVALWRYRAEPEGGDARVQIDRVGGETGLVADLEGVAILHGPGGGGYLLLSNQGAHDFAVYRRDGGNEFLGRFRVTDDPASGIDGAVDTDGIEVTGAALGARYPEGLLVVQDGSNEPPGQNQNFKYLSWREVARALGLPPP